MKLKENSMMYAVAAVFTFLWITATCFFTVASVTAIVGHALPWWVNAWCIWMALSITSTNFNGK